MTHPTHEQLATFAAGRLGDDDSNLVEEHLAECDECCQWLKQSPGHDSYVALLRDAASDSRADMAAPIPPTAAMAGSATKAPHNERLPVASSEGAEELIAGLPSELTDHPRYRVIRSLGSGGMGAVFEAEHRLMRRRVVLKIIKPKWLSNSEAVMRFRREIQAAAKLVHPHVVTAFDAEQAGDVHFLAMEYVDGVNLAELISQRGPLPVEMACECIRQAALGLQHAYEHGMVHRDIKPGNLMAEWRVGSGEWGVKSKRPVSHPPTPHSPLPTIKILDFGLARFASEEAEGVDTSAGVLLGTPDFMAPEQARNSRAADIRSDLYSLGCTFYFLLTGEVPHPGAKTALERALAHAECAPQLLATFRDDVPLALQEVLNRLLAKRPEDRFQTPAELADALALPTRLVSVGWEMHSPRLHQPLAAGFKRVLMAFAFVGFILVMAVIVQVVTDKGDLRIQCDADAVVLLLSQAGRPVWRIEAEAGSSVKRLPSGEYSLQLKDSPNDLQLSTNRVVLSRGRSVDVVVSRIK